MDIRVRCAASLVAVATGVVLTAVSTAASASAQTPKNCPFDYYGSPYSISQDDAKYGAVAPKYSPSAPYSHFYGNTNPYGDDNGCVGIGGSGTPSGTVSGVNTYSSGATTTTNTTGVSGTAPSVAPRPTSTPTRSTGTTTGGSTGRTGTTRSSTGTMGGGFG
jgi:hypothetical protein